MKLVSISTQSKKETLSEYVTINEKSCVSKLTDLSLEEYCLAHNKYCSLHHVSLKCDCQCMIAAAEKVLLEGVCSLS